MPPANRFQRIVADAKSRIREISPAEADQRRRDGVLLIDVREAEDFAKGHAQGAIHLSRGVIELKIEELAGSSHTDCLLLRWRQPFGVVAESLQRMGYTNVASMTGGFKSWKEQGLTTT